MFQNNHAIQAIDYVITHYPFRNGYNVSGLGVVNDIDSAMSVIMDDMKASKRPSEVWYVSNIGNKIPIRINVDTGDYFINPQ